MLKLIRNTGHTTRFLATREVLILFSTYLVYSISKNLIDSTPILRAFGNAWSLVRFQEQLGIAHEATVQVWASMFSAGFLHFLAYFYAVGLWVALLGSAAFMFIYNRRLYYSLRNIYLVTMLTAVVVFAVYPLAPPRLLPGYGMTDIAHTLGLLPKEGSRSFFGYNEFAAMPSLHIAWSLLIMMAWWKWGWKWGKVLSALYVALMTLAVVATANHYFLDVAAGALLLAFAIWVIGLPASLKKMVEERDLWDLRDTMRRWPQAFPEGGFRFGYHRPVGFASVQVRGGAAPFSDASFRILS